MFVKSHFRPSIACTKSLNIIFTHLLQDIFTLAQPSKVTKLSKFMKSHFQPSIACPKSLKISFICSLKDVFTFTQPSKVIKKKLSKFVKNMFYHCIVSPKLLKIRMCILVSLYYRFSSFTKQMCIICFVECLLSGFHQCIRNEFSSALSVILTTKYTYTQGFCSKMTDLRTFLFLI